MVSPIVIAGPTASGKSSFALQMAGDIGGELICADSRQVYQDMSIGTAGPTAAELKQIPHHGFGVIDPNNNYDAGQFVAHADQHVAEVISRGKVPILVGGTGLYLKSFRYGVTDVPERNEKIRKEIAAEIKQIGLPAVYEKLSKIDLVSAQKIMPNDEVRISRALEIFHITNEKPSKLRKSHENAQPRVDAKWILLWPDRDTLWTRIEKRVVAMFEGGLVEEALHLKSKLDPENTKLKTMGYEEALLLADNKIDKNEAVEKTTIRHRQYAKRQMTWFKKETWWERGSAEKSH